MRIGWTRLVDDHHTIRKLLKVPSQAPLACPEIRGWESDLTELDEDRADFRCVGDIEFACGACRKVLGRPEAEGRDRRPVWLGDPRR